MITGIRKIVLPVDDEQRALEFWTARLGFTVVCDQPYGDNQRWIEVAPADRSVVLILSRRPPGEPVRSVPDVLPHSPVFFNADDIRKTHAELSARGVRFAAEPVQMPFGWWAMFEDHEGTRYALGQW